MQLITYTTIVFWQYSETKKNKKKIETTKKNCEILNQNCEIRIPIELSSDSVNKELITVTPPCTGKFWKKLQMFVNKYLADCYNCFGCQVETKKHPSHTRFARIKRIWPELQLIQGMCGFHLSRPHLVADLQIYFAAFELGQDFSGQRFRLFSRYSNRMRKKQPKKASLRIVDLLATKET